MFASLIHKMASTSKIPPRTRLEVENLEDRMVPSTLLAEQPGGSQVDFSVARSKGEEIPSLNRSADAAATVLGTNAQASRGIGEEIPQAFRHIGEEIPQLTGGRGGIGGDFPFAASPEAFRRIGEEIPQLTGGRGGMGGELIFGMDSQVTRRIGEEIPTLTGGRGGISGECAFNSQQDYARASTAVFSGIDHDGAGVSGAHMTLNARTIGEEIPS